MSKLSFRPWRPALAAVTVVMALSACAIGPDYQRPVLDLPSTPVAPTATLTQDWWTQFQDPVLNDLIQRAQQHNQDIARALARLDEASAGLTSARADQLPQLGVNGQYQRARLSSVGSNTSLDRGEKVIGSMQTGQATLSYQLDLWGRYRRASEAARAELLASQFAKDTVNLSVAAQVAQGYFTLRALDQQLQIAEQTLQSRQASLALREKRYRGGVSSELEYRQAQAETAATQAAVPRLQQAQAAAEKALQVLIGASPRELMTSQVPRGKAVTELTTPPLIPAELPSQLLEQRPDLRAAEARLIAANARIGVAKAAYFPNISLTGNLGSESLRLADLFSAPAQTWSFVGQLAMPIFDFGKTGAAVDAASAQQRQALADYTQAVQNAFRETYVALQAHRTSREQFAAQTAQVDALRRALRLAQLRYDNGYSSYLEVLDAQRNLFSAEIDWVQTRQAQLDAVVSVYLALGGGWSTPKP